MSARGVFFRLWRALFLVLGLLAVLNVAEAAPVQSDGFRYCVHPVFGNLNQCDREGVDVFYDVDAAKAAFYARCVSAYGAANCDQPDFDSGSWRIRYRPTGGANVSMRMLPDPLPMCPAGYWVLDDGSCVEERPEPFDCTASAAAFNALPASGRVREVQGRPGKIDACLDGAEPGQACRVTGRPDFSVQYDGAWRTTIVFSMHGGVAGSCDPATYETEDPGATTQEVPPEAPACPGGIQGEIGGETVCVPAKGNPDATVESRTTETKQITDSGNNEQTVTTETVTTCTGDTCTTTKTTTVTGSASGTGFEPGTTIEATTGPRGEFCVQNPSSPQCRAGVGDGSGEGDGDDTNAGGSLPGIPAMYEAKGDTLADVWDARMSQLKSTPLISLASRLMPTMNTGTNPEWIIDLNMGGLWDLGSYDISPGSNIWAALRALVLVLAGIFCARLIYGGV